MTQPSPSSKKRRAGPEDVEIGRKIRLLRLERGLSQSDLAKAIGLTFQQVQKYEKGANRVSAGRLQQIADFFKVSIMFFFGGMGAKPKRKDERGSILALLQTKGAVRLLRAFGQIASRSTKYALIVLAEASGNPDRANSAS
jgi:transcriptional regulator with XRE-family HTH domain